MLLISDRLKNKNILQITYNKALKEEVRHKKCSLDLYNLDIHTYHSMAIKYYR